MAQSRTRRFSSISTIPNYSALSTTPLYKVITVGNSGVGKSTLLASFSQGTFQQDLAEQSSVDGKLVKRGQNTVQIALWDTAGKKLDY